VLRRARRALPGGVEAEERVELGVAATRLSEIASETSAALIVVGCRGRGPLASALLGSVSWGLAERGRCPVMIVPETASKGTQGRSGKALGERSAIVAAMDDSSESSKVSRFARELADRSGDRLLIVPTHAAADPPALTLQATVAREHARLVVIAAGRGDGGRFTPLGSVATRLPQLTRRPVIVIPEDATASLDQTGEAIARQAAQGAAGSRSDRPVTRAREARRGPRSAAAARSRPSARAALPHTGLAPLGAHPPPSRRNPGMPQQNRLVAGLEVWDGE
jgi:nucleotide-binding universal stress UspA family protein